MAATLEIFNATVVANVLNPSIMREGFLSRIGVLREEPQPGYLFTDQGAFLRTSAFALTVTPQVLQLAPGGRASAAATVREVLGGIVSALPHTPYAAVGLNFVWSVDPAPETVAQASRRLFYSGSRGLGPTFDAEDAHFGVYASTDVRGSRMKLDVKPVSRDIAGVAAARLLFSFNFHKDVTAAGDEGVSQIGAHLEQWADLDSMAEEIVLGVLKGTP